MAMKNENIFKIIGMIAPLFVTCCLLAAQWGSVKTQMGVFEKSLDRMAENIEKKDERTAAAIEKTNDALIEMQKDMAYIKGKMKGIGE